jgi:NAD/NADP transhydrogenase alpha subunit
MAVLTIPAIPLPRIYYFAEGSIYIGFLSPFNRPDITGIFTKKDIIGFAMEFIPRLTRSQNMDALSSMATLAGFVGYEVIRRVTPLLHTPLMSATNAISGISLVGSLVAAGSNQSFLSTLLGFIAVTAATINVVGGFMITDRKLWPGPTM